MQAIKDADMYGQAMANRTPGACKQITIYAKLSYENVYYMGTSSFGDVAIRFYSDQACTNPVYVNKLSVNCIMYHSFLVMNRLITQLQMGFKQL
jgi:hypothetical protein